jgi:hypothetical protein
MEGIRDNRFFQAFLFFNILDIDVALRLLQLKARPESVQARTSHWSVIGQHPNPP